jgi:hypothetical protein
MNDSDRKLLNELEDHISFGYQWIEKIEEEYQNRSESNPISSILNKYYHIVNEWQEQVKQTLPNAYKRTKFANARNNDPVYESGKNADIQNLIKSIRAKINTLEEFRQELQQPFINLGPQARLNYHSTDNSTNIIGDQYLVTVNQLETEFENNYHGVDKDELLGLIKELRETKSNSKRTREILGMLLTRGAELAQIASLVIQLLGNN